MHSEWYSAKTVYKHHLVEEGVSKPVFEERVVLLRAASFEDAITQAEAEASEYATGCSVPVNYLHYVMVYRLSAEESVGHGTEVYSLLRDSMLSDKDYLDRFYDDGQERSGHAPPDA